MADTKQSPMVLVKKADGTTMRVSLDELKKMQGTKEMNPESRIMNQETEKKQETTRAPQKVELKVEPKKTLTTPPRSVVRERPSIPQKLTKLTENVMVKPMQAIATTAPVVDIFKDEAMATSMPSAPVKVAPPAVAQFRSQLQKVAGTVGDGARDHWTPPLGKPMMNDIQAPQMQKTTTGPAEEMEAMTLTDFRRLAPRPKEAAGKLMGKFENWKHESFLLYQDVVPAWRQSPLYRTYQKVVTDALSSGKKLHELFATMNPKTEITEDEFNELVNVNHSLV